MQQKLILLATALALVAPYAQAMNPLDDDAGSGGDAGDTRETAVHVQPGRIEGRLTPPADAVDVYSFEAEEGDGIAWDPLWSVKAEFWSPSGERIRSTSFLASETGTWFLRLETAIPWPAPWYAPYDFELRLADLPPHDDAGSGRDASASDPVELEQGMFDGAVDAYDRRDVYRVALDAGAFATVLVEGDASLAVGWLSAKEVHVGSTRDGDGTRLRVFTANATDVHFFVDPAYPERRIEYRMTLERQDLFGGRSLDDVPTAAPLPAYASALSLRYDGSVDGISSHGWWHFDGAEGRKVRGDVYGYRTLARDADDRLYYVPADGRSLVHRVDETGPVEPYVAAGEPLAFGPDGATYVVDRTEVSRLADDGRPVRVAVLPLGGIDLAFAPDGSLHVLSFAGIVYRVEDGRAVAAYDAGPGARMLAFGGDGSLYVLRNERPGYSRDGPSLLLRFDESGPRLVGRGPGWAHDLVVGEGKAFIGAEQLFAVDVTSTMFRGFLGRGGDPLLPDLEITLEVLDPTQPFTHARDILVTVANEGTGYAPRHAASVSICNRTPVHDHFGHCGSRRQFLEPVHVDEPIAPGESMTHRFRWNPTEDVRFGDLRVDAWVGAFDADVYDHATTTTCVRVCGTGVGV